MDGTNPGLHSQFNIENYPPDEQRIIRRLSQDWYITAHGREVRLGANSAYRYFLMKPSDRLKELVNFDREIVAVFSSYDRFEPRTLDAFETVYAEFQPLRLEKICQVLISKDFEIRSKVTTLIKSDPESPVVIPFHYSELSLASLSSDIENRIREAFYSRDLFSFQSPLRKDTYFFGRTNLIHSLIGRHKAQENSGLFGLRKSGKTSIIYGIERTLTAQNLPFYTIDCQSPAIHQRPWSELLSLIVRNLKAQCQSSAKLTGPDQYSAQNASLAFERDMKSISRSLDRRPILLIFDEIERISPRTASSEHWRTGEDFVYFWQTLRSVFQKNRELYTYLLVGTNPSAIEADKIGTHENPIFSSIPLSYVPGFELAQVREMVSRLGSFMGLVFDDFTYAKLAEDFGGHPFLIRQFCSKLHNSVKQRRPAKIDRSVYTAVKAEFDSECASYIEMILGVLKDHYPEEYDMARYLAVNDLDSFNDLAQHSPIWINHLLGYELVERGAANYFFRIQAVGEFLRAAHRFERAGLSDEEKSIEICERRNSIERRLRVLIKRQLRARDGRKKALASALAAIDANRRDALAGYDLDALFDSHTCPIFFADLLAIISREWDLFKNVFDLEKGRVTVMLEDINRFRVDAHAKSIHEQDFTQLRLHFDKLEAILNGW